jgi:three-Cys-motif partner protein
MKRFDPLIETQPDGFAIPEVGSWSTTKWSLMGAYCDIFTSGMRRKWDQLVYIDLFAGAGFAKIKNTNRIYHSSALIALSTPVKFDKYIFCEKDPELFNALEQRVKRLFPDENISLVCGDANEEIENIKSLMPAYGKGNTRLPFCFVDPFSLELEFSTIKNLGADLMDFLILLALHMDANRNLQNYLNENNNKIALFTGDENWRKKFEKFDSTGRDFIKFLAKNYDQNMIQMDYVKPASKHLVRSSNKNLPLYYLAFYSKNERGNDFYKKVKRTATGQTELGL